MCWLINALANVNRTMPYLLPYYNCTILIECARVRVCVLCDEILLTEFLIQFTRKVSNRSIRQTHNRSIVVGAGGHSIDVASRDFQWLH